MSDEHDPDAESRSDEVLIERPPAEGVDPDAPVEPVLAPQGMDSQAEGADPDHPDDEAVLDAVDVEPEDR